PRPQAQAGHDLHDRAHDQCRQGRHQAAAGWLDGRHQGPLALGAVGAHGGRHRGWLRDPDALARWLRGISAHRSGRRRRLSLPRMKRYERLSEEVTASIRSGVLQVGDRLPSVRQTSLSRKVSPSTVFKAYYLLEAKGLIRARERSGYYVVATPDTMPPELEHASL